MLPGLATPEHPRAARPKTLSPAGSPAGSGACARSSKHRTSAQPTEVLGVVDVHAPGSNEQQGLEIMRERAAAMHADGVIGVEFHRDNHDFTDLSGLAVRFRNLQQDRPFDVPLQEIQVHEGEGQDGEAMTELLRRARALNADLIVDISWHDNDAVQDGTYLSGTAIRYR